jgi:hypothetical protein
LDQLAFRGMPAPGPTARFTFALHEYNKNTSIYDIGKVSRMRKLRGSTGLCILFSPPLGGLPNDISHLNTVMDAPLIPQIVDPKGPLWFQQLRNHIVVSNHLQGAFLVPSAEAGSGLGLLEMKNGQWEKTIWGYFDLFKYCFNLEKIASNCAGCQNNGTDCVLYCIQSRAEEKGIPVPKLPVERKDNSVIDDLDPDEIGELLKRLSANSPWEYVSPKSTSANPFSPSLLQIEEVAFLEVEEIRQARHEQAQKAADTRKAVKRCKKECVYEPYCRWCVQPYWGRPRDCQNGNPYGSLSVGGPYVQKQFDKSFYTFWQGLPHLDRKKIEMIAFNAGITTNIFGYELMLSKMVDLMDAVEFIRPTTGDTRLVDFEEAVMLCTTPYREDGQYVYPSRTSSYRNRVWTDSPPPMPDDELFTYVEICQHDCTLQGGWGFSNSYPTIREVMWSPGHVKFDTDKSWCSGHVSSVFDFTQSYSQQNFPKMAQWVSAKEAGETGQ